MGATIRPQSAGYSDTIGLKAMVASQTRPSCESVTMTDRPYVFDEARPDAELERLRALEGIFDAATRDCLLATGLAPGWRCLEVGPGAGSIARWLSETVTEAGHVLAVDVNARFLAGRSKGNLEIREADIRTASLQAGSVDLAHARFVLIHVPQWMEALAAMIASLKPGGWIVLEEPDFSSSRALAGPPDLRRAFDNVHRAIEAMFCQRNMDHAFGARLPALLQGDKLESIAIENDAPIVAGGSPQARMMAMSTFQLAEKYVATGLASRQDIELYGRFAADPTCWATYHATIRGVARKRAGRDVSALGDV
jgi:SAM-dependent methyltransferase